MAKIKDIEQLREFALETIERLANGEIDTANAATTGKLCENVISTVKTQLEYSRMINEEQPNIPFMNLTASTRQIEGKVIPRSLGYKGK